MKIIKITLLSIIFFGFFSLPQLYATKTKIKAKDKNVERRIGDSLAIIGVKLVDKGKYREALQYYNRALEIDSTYEPYIYEKAFTYYKLMNYDSVVVMLEPLVQRQGATTNTFQILGISYEILKKNVKARETFLNGIRTYPKAANLYMEMGIFELGQDSTMMAQYYWEKGISVNPNYSINYYHLARYFSKTTQFFWSLTYAEIFMNLSENTTMLNNLSKLMDEMYKRSFYSELDSVTTKIRFTDFEILGKNLKAREDLPLPFAYQLIMREAAKDLLPKDKSKFTIDVIYKIRKKFIEIWYKENWNKRYSLVLFDLQRDLIKAGHFETYIYWLLNASRQIEAKKWIMNNKGKLSTFGKWMVKHRLKFNRANFISRNRF